MDKLVYAASEKTAFGCPEDNIYVLVVRFYGCVSVLPSKRKVSITCEPHINFDIYYFSTYAQKASTPNSMVLILRKHYVAHYKTIFVGFQDCSRYIRAPSSCKVHARVTILLILEQAFFCQA